MKNLIFSLFLLVSGLAIANDNAPVAIRPMSNEVLKELSDAKNNEDAPNSEAAVAPCEEQVLGCVCDCPPIYYPKSAHWIVALSAFGDSIGIEDGSVWQVNGYDIDLIHYWFPDDPVTITQNRDWFSSYKYLIVNQNNGSSVAANLSLGPIIDEEHSLQIAYIDHYNDLLEISDHSHWKISSRDHYLFLEWAPGDYIIVGVNNGCDSSSPFILINSNMDNCVRAKQY